MKNIDIGKRIRQIADQQHWQLSDLARALNCSRSSLYHIFNSRDITLGRLIRISRVFNYNLLDEILRDIAAECPPAASAAENAPKPFLAIPFVDSEIDISDIPLPVLRALRTKLDEACRDNATPDELQFGHIRPETDTPR